MPRGGWNSCTFIRNVKMAGGLLRPWSRNVINTIAVTFVCTALALIYFRTGMPLNHDASPLQSPVESVPEVPQPPPGPPGPPPEPTWVHKPLPPPKPPVTDHFLRAVSAKSPADLPPVPSWNAPPSRHVDEITPLFIGFTRSWELLQQCIVSYLTAGWPREDIYVVENTGTMDANRLGKLTLQNPFYINYQRLTDVFGVNVLTTPTLLSFAQLQNFYLHTAITKGWEHYFWGHMDVAVLSNEDFVDSAGEYKSLYMRCVEDIREARKTSSEPDDRGRTGGYAIRFHAYDALAMVNTSAFEHVGGWDTMIPYYGTDCDMHSRLFMSGFKQSDTPVGRIFDVASSLEDVEVLYRRKSIPPDTRGSFPDVRSIEIPPEDTRGSTGWEQLRDQLQELQNAKYTGDRLRWQAAQQGGQGEPYYRDALGFQRSLDLWTEQGKALMAEKWGHRGCNLKGLEFEDAWRVEKDW